MRYRPLAAATFLAAAVAASFIAGQSYVARSTLVRVAKQQSPRPDRATITKLVIDGDTARVTVSTHALLPGVGDRLTEQDLPFIRTWRGWKLDDTRMASDRSVDAFTPPDALYPTDTTGRSRP
jgi:hypothetical protein